VLTAQVEAYAEAFQEVVQHYPSHWEEVALDTDKDEARLAPMWAIYDQRDAAGELLLVTLRETGRLVGYFLGFITPGLHYRHCLTFQMDIYWVHPSVRGRFGGKRLVRAVIAECRRRGVKRMFAGEKLHKPSGRLFEAFGFRPVETHYSLWLEDN
jgi:L-amino acid N-acyltransferase YncA